MRTHQCSISKRDQYPRVCEVRDRTLHKLDNVGKNMHMYMDVLSIIAIHKSHEIMQKEFK